MAESLADRDLSATLDLHERPVGGKFPGQLILRNNGVPLGKADVFVAGLG
jgi:hypothetical protein